MLFHPLLPPFAVSATRNTAVTHSSLHTACTPISISPGFRFVVVLIFVFVCVCLLDLCWQVNRVAVSVGMKTSSRTASRTAAEADNVVVKYKYELALFVVALATRLWRIDFPNSVVFDEVCVTCC